MVKDFIKNILLKKYIFVYVLYFLIIFLETTTFVIDYPWIFEIMKVVRYGLYAFFILRIFIMIPEIIKELNFKSWKNKTIINRFIIVILFIFFASIAINFITTGNKRMVILMIVLLASYKTDYKKIIKYTMVMQIVFTSLTTLASVLGITQNYIVLRPTGEERYSLGFMYTTNFAQMIIFSIILYLYIKDFKVNYLELFVMQILNTLIYFITDSRTEFLMLECIIIFMFIYKSSIWPKLYKFFRSILKIFSYTFIIYPIISFIIVLLYPTGGIFNNIDQILSYRLSQTNDVLQEHGVTLFGEDIQFVGNSIKSKIDYEGTKSNYVDNEYIQMMFKEGIIVAICFIIILSFMLVLLLKKNRQKEIFLCSIYLIFGLMNPRIITLVFCPILFIVIPTFFEYFKECNKLTEKIKE